MKKLTAVLCILLSLALVAAVFAACGKKVEKADDDNAETDAVLIIEGDTAEPDAADADATDETEAEPVSYPTADGQNVKAYDVSFYLPENLTPNGYNGMLGVYEFYTGDYSNSSPTGMDFTLMVSAESNTNGDLAAYARDASRKSSGADAEPEEVEFNGFTWLRFTVSADQVNYYAVFNDGLYEIVTRRGGDTQENYDAAKQMLEDTLFLAVAQD
ncbi:MAG: hypothetical protein IJT27_03755 [Clostridia bacterium]|nr:hypothetical protein [Clostridia bacterium]